MASDPDSVAERLRAIKVDYDAGRLHIEELRDRLVALDPPYDPDEWATEVEASDAFEAGLQRFSRRLRWLTTGEGEPE